MRKIKSLVSVVLLVAILCGCFAGCGTLKGDAVVSYGDYVVDEVMYQYWLAKYKTVYLYTYNNAVDTESFWTSKIDEQSDYTYEDFLVEYIRTYAKHVAVAMCLFDEYGMSFTSKQKENINNRIEQLIEYYGGKNVFNETLGEMGLNIETLKKIYYAEAKLDVVNEYFFGKNGVLEVSDNDREAYYNENYYSAMWIVMYPDTKFLKDETTGKYVCDTNGNRKYVALESWEKEAKELEINNLKKDLAAGKDFKALREEYSEEGGSEWNNYPDGMIFSANDYETYGAEMVETVKALKVNDYSIYTLGESGSRVMIFVKRLPLKNYASLTQVERELLVDFDEYVYYSKSEEFFEDYEVAYYEDVMNRYDIKKIKGTKNTSI